MPTSPLLVTRRYASNLLSKGKNNEYEVVQLARDVAMDDELVIGSFYRCTLTSATTVAMTTHASGATPLQALERALSKAGVTFR